MSFLFVVLRLFARLLQPNDGNGTLVNLVLRFPVWPNTLVNKVLRFPVVVKHIGQQSVALSGLAQNGHSITTPSMEIMLNGWL